MIKFQLTISTPGHLDAEDELSNLLQGAGEEKDLEFYIRDAVRAWVAVWMPHVSSHEVRVKIE